MRLRLALFLLTTGIVLSALSGCFLGNGGADKKLGDVVQNLNDQARWGRISDAALLVQPDYLEAFLERHRQWGSEIQLADTEVVNVQLASDSEHASAVVNYSWYSIADMNLYETTLRQVWSARKNSFALVSEAVLKGNPGLFSAPAPNGAAIP
jgi:hypothetical protein